MMLKYFSLAAVLALGAATLPVASVAQGYPGGMTMQAHVLSGRVDSFDGGYHLVVHGMRVQLHQGTIIRPTGMSLRPGQFVVVHGSWVGHHFAADQIRIRP